MTCTSHTKLFDLPLKRCAHLALLLLALPSLTLAANAPCDSASEGCVPVGQWDIGMSVGVGARSNPVLGGRTIPLVILPKISYYGKRFFLDNLELGYTLHESQSTTLSAVAAPGYDRAFFSRNDPQNFLLAGSIGGAGLSGNTYGALNHVPPSLPAQPSPAELILRHARRVTYLAGLEWTFDYQRITGQLTALREITGRHDGAEARMGLATRLIDSKSKLTAAAGATWKSSAIVTYYYGAQGVYEPGAAFNPFAKLSFARPLTKHWSITAFAHYEWLDRAIAKSPIVIDDHVATAFIGASYAF